MTKYVLVPTEEGIQAGKTELEFTNEKIAKGSLKLHREGWFTLEERED